MVGVYNDFCGNSSLWDSDLLLNSTYPNFSKCFQQTVLIWVPCGLLWLTTPYHLYYLIRKIHDQALPHNFLNISKSVLSLTLSLLMVMDLVKVSLTWEPEPISVFVCIVIKCLTFILTLFLIQLGRMKGVITSGILFLFWLLMLVVGIIPFYTFIIQKFYEENLFRFTMFYIYWSALLVQLLLHCFAEKSSHPKYTDTDRPACPQLKASFISKISYWWVNSLVFTGFKKSLVEEDMWDLPPKNKGENVVPQLERVWKNEVTKCKKYNDKIKELNEESDFPIQNSFAYEIKANGSAEMVPLAATKGYESKHFKGNSDKSAKLKHPSLLKVILKTFGKETLKGMCSRLFFDMMVFVNPMLLGLLISYTQNKEEEPQWKGYFISCLFFISAVIQYSIFHFTANRMLVLGLRTKMALVAAVYKKSLIMNNDTKKSSTVGEIVNLMSVDCGRVEDLNLMIMFLVSVPTRFFLCVVLLWRTLGPSVLVGLCLIVILIPINTVISSNQRRLNRKLMEYKDVRIKLMSEVLNGIKVLKLYAWEKSFQEKVEKIRNKELEVLSKLNLLASARVFSFASAPFLVSLISFSVYVFTSDGNYLDAQKAFVSLALFNNLKFPLNMLPNVITYFIQAHVSIARISKFLRSGELDPDNVQHKDTPDITIKVENGTFSWDENLEPALKEINFEIPTGKLAAIVGQVGAGKSSLLSAFLGEMDKLQGTVNITGSVAYVPQQAWIQNATLRENILFGSSYDKDKYNQVIEACALGPDLEILSGGDMAEIGEKGINLSGGQKQRVSLARAVYNNADVYLMDDPLSAVDSHVGKHIFDKVMGPKGLLRNKTRILVTHGVHWLPMVDSIVVLTDGRISEVGTYEQLMDHDGAFAQFLKTYLLENKRDDNKEKIEEVTHMLEKFDLEHPNIDHQSHDIDKRSVPISDNISTANRANGTTHLHGHYSTHVKPSYNRSISAFENASENMERSTPKAIRRRRFDKFHYHSNGTLNDIKPNQIDIAKSKDNVIYTSLSSINQEVGEEDEDEGSKGEIEEELKDAVLITEEETEKGKVRANVFTKYFRAIGFGWFGLIMVVLVIQQMAGSAANILLSHWTEDPLLKNRILSNTTEYKSRNIMFIGIYAACGIGETFIELSYTLLILMKGITASRTLHKDMLDNILRLPMSFFDTTPIGRVLNRFSSDIQKIDQNLPGTFRMWFAQLFHTIAIVIVISSNTPIFLSVIIPAAILYFLIQRYYVPTSRQLQRLESKTRSPVYSHFGETITGTSTIRAFGQTERFILESQKRVDTNILFRFALVMINRWSGIRLECTGSLFILSAAMFAVITPGVSGGVVGLSVAYALQITGSLNALVRTTSDLETNIVTVERVKEYSELKTEAEWVIPSNRPPVTWPDSGKIVFKDYKTRYRPGLDLVLRGISCDVQGGEKVGIVGRTGAGKSSLMTALFRLIEAAEGSIIIDGQPIADMGLHDLRSKLTILPQDPVLFSGTLRMNLDPFDNYSDEELWQAIEHAHLKKFVSSLPSGLLHECGEGGQNLSVGQRQLVCLSRTLLNKTKILILDEATAAVDMETDELIQKTIRTEFKDCTVLTIAHRLNTIMDYDKVLVLGHGLVIEYDSPNNLLKDKNSVFYGMAKDSNLI